MRKSVKFEPVARSTACELSTVGSWNLGGSGYDVGGMKRRDLTERMARQSRTTEAEAADRLDRVVHDLIQKLKRGQRVSLPGLGDLIAHSTKPASADEKSS